MSQPDPRITRLLATLRFGKSVATECTGRDVSLLYSTEDARVIAELLDSLGSPLFHTHPKGFRTRRMIEEGYTTEQRRKPRRKPEQIIFG